MNKAEILSVDNEELIRKLLEITLKANNYTVSHTSTAKEEIMMASNHPPDLITLDPGLPDNDGLSVLQELRQWHTNPVTVMKKGELVKLTVTEYSLLALFAQNDGKVLTHQYLLRAIWGPGFTNQSQYMRMFIAQIRKKIEDDANRPEYLVTEPGVGYRFVGRQV